MLQYLITTYLFLSLSLSLSPPLSLSSSPSPPLPLSLSLLSQEFQLPVDVKCLFAVEMTEDHAKAKDHLAVSKGEQCFVLLISHPKLNSEKYFVEKEDGTSEWCRR